MIFNPSNVLIALISAAAFGFASPTPTSEHSEDVTIAKRVWLSNIDVQAACAEQQGPRFNAVLVDSTKCNGWHCMNNKSDPVSRNVEMNEYCVVRFGRLAYASCGGGTAWDWQCHDRN